MNSLKDKQLQHFANISYEDIFLYDDVKEAVNDIQFILSCWAEINSGTYYDLDKLNKICVKYKLNIGMIIKQDISHEELIEVILGDFEK